MNEMFGAAGRAAGEFTRKAVGDMWSRRNKIYSAAQARQRQAQTR